MTSLGPAGDGFFNEPGFRIMLREEFGLVVHCPGRMSFERCGDLRVQLLPGIAQQAAVRRVLHQRVLEAVDCVGWHAALIHELGSDEPSERGLQLVLGKAGDDTQQRVRKLASNRGPYLRHQPHGRQPVEP